MSKDLFYIDFEKNLFEKNEILNNEIYLKIINTKN